MKKIKILISYILILCLIVIVFPHLPTEAASDVIEISSVKDLKKISKNLSGNYILTKDINLKSKTWTPIGTTSAPFTGTFDGNGHTIKKIKTKASKDYQGLFGFTKDATIKNLKVTGTVKGNLYVGGIVGQMEGGRIVNCVNNAKIFGVDQVGGIVGRISGAIAINCQNNAKVTGTGRCTGGITADLYPSGTIYNCVNLGTIVGGNDLNGGISGGSTSGEIANCVNFGNVTGKGRIGAIAGDNASYAGTRYFNYFRQTSKINSAFNAIGTGCYTFSKAKGNLSGTVTIDEKDYQKLIDALNAGRSALKKETGEELKKWSVYKGKPVLFK